MKRKKKKINSFQKRILTLITNKYCNGTVIHDRHQDTLCSRLELKMAVILHVARMICGSWLLGYRQDPRDWTDTDGTNEKIILHKLSSPLPPAPPPPPLPSTIYIYVQNDLRLRFLTDLSFRSRIIREMSQVISLFTGNRRIGGWLRWNPRI